MTVLALVVGALLAFACVAYVALPFLREPEPEDDVLAEPGRARAPARWSWPRSATGRSPRSRSSSSTTGPARSPTTTTGSSSARCAGG